MRGSIVIIGTLDTKGEEIAYLKQLIGRRGHDTIVLDCGVFGKPIFPPEVTREEVAEASGVALNHVVALKSEKKAMDTMARGAAAIVGKLYLNKKLDGILAIGGSMGTGLGLSVMNVLPTGVPKLMLSTVAFAPFLMQGMASSGFMRTDITMMQSTVDFWGLNSIVKRVLEQAAGAITGMVEMKVEGPPKPLIGLTTLGGVACNYVSWIKPLVEAKGYELIIFHTSGMGAIYLEAFVKQEALVGVLDLSPHEMMEELYGELGLKGGGEEMKTMGGKNIPRVVSPGCLNWFAWAGPEERLPSHLKNRKMVFHTEFAISIKASKEEMSEVGRTMACKLNKAVGPTTVIIPTEGFDERDKPGGVYYDPEADRALTEALKKHIKPEIKVMELDVHLNDQTFAEAAVATLFRMIEKTA